MKFISTRGQTPSLGFSDAVATGLAPDGGLFLPETLPDFSGQLAAFGKLSYAELCFEFMRVFATDIPAATLRTIVDESYTTFADPAIAPLKPLGKNLYVLELFHGPTLAFKDFALQLLGNLYAHQCVVRRETINVLGATSGDTGAAAIHGLLGKPGTAIFILYPDGRVSPLQERQMACTGAANVFAIAIDGSFDDAQASLKEIFGDQAFRTHHRLSAVNSINLARVLAQCVYFSGYQGFRQLYLMQFEQAFNHLAFNTVTNRILQLARHVALHFGTERGFPATFYIEGGKEGSIEYRQHGFRHIAYLYCELYWLTGQLLVLVVLRKSQRQFRLTPFLATNKTRLKTVDHAFGA